jgi:hypothetical protein
MASATVSQQSGSGSVGPLSLPASGTYKITLDPGSSGTGRIVVTVTGPVIAN